MAPAIAMQRTQGFAKNLLHITKVVQPEDAYKLENSTIFLYSPKKIHIIGKKECTRPYIVKDVVKRILNHKKIHGQEKYNPCNIRMCSKIWTDIQEVIGTSGIIELCTMYIVFEQVNKNSYIQYFTDTSTDMVFKKDKALVKWDPVKRIKGITGAEIYGDRFTAYSDEIDRTVVRLRNISTRGIVSSFIKTKKAQAKEISRNRSGKKQGIEQHEIKIETVVKILYVILKKVFSHAIPAEGMERVKRKIRWFLLNTRGRVHKADIYSELKTNFKGRIRNSDPLLYKQYMVKTIDFIFIRFLPYLMRIHIVGVGSTEETARFFFREGYAEMEKRFKEAYIEKYFVKVKPGEKTSLANPARMMLIPKKNTFRTVFKVMYEKKEDGGFAIMREKMACAVLTREAGERVEWETTRKCGEKREPRKRVYNSIFKTSDILLKITQFKEQHFARFLRKDPLFILLLDIENCFDNMSLEVINETGLLKKLMGKREYEVFKWRDTTEDGLTIHRRIPMYPDECADEGNLALKKLPPKAYRVFNSSTIFKEEEIEEMLDRSVNNSILEHEGEVYRRAKGINQGFRFSSHICAYYMSVFDSNVYRGLENTQVIRYVDDSMVLSWSMEELEKVVERMKELEGRCGISLNMAKCKVFTAQKRTEDALFVDSIPVAHVRSFKWCGIHFNAETLASFMAWTTKRVATPTYKLQNIKKWMLYNIRINSQSGLFHKDNPAKDRNMRLFVRHQVEKTLNILQNKGNKQIEGKTIQQLFRIIIRILRWKDAFSVEEIRKAFRAAVYIYRQNTCKNKQ